MVAALRRLACSLRGHDALLHFEDGRMSLKCTSCPYETPGWDLKPTPAPPMVGLAAVLAGNNEAIEGCTSHRFPTASPAGRVNRERFGNDGGLVGCVDDAERTRRQGRTFKQRGYAGRFANVR